MTASTLLFVLIGHRTSLRERLLLREALGVTAVGEVLRLASRILLMTAVIEAAGVCYFFVRFLAEQPPGPALWRALFHSVSAFNNAGFDLAGGFQNLTTYRGDAAFLLGTSALIIAGGFSFTFFADTLRVRSFRRLTLDSKLVLVTNVGLLVVGALLFWLIEHGNPRTLGGETLAGQALDAFFLSVSARTAGFNTLDLGWLTEQSLFFMMALMFVGTASGSTGGGIKINTFAVLALAVRATVFGRRRVEAFGREIPDRADLSGPRRDVPRGDRRFCRGAPSHHQRERLLPAAVLRGDLGFRDGGALGRGHADAVDLRPTGDHPHDVPRPGRPADVRPRAGSARATGGLSLPDRGGEDRLSLLRYPCRQPRSGDRRPSSPPLRHWRMVGQRPRRAHSTHRHTTPDARVTWCACPRPCLPGQADPVGAGLWHYSRAERPRPDR